MTQVLIEPTGEASVTSTLPAPVGRGRHPLARFIAGRLIGAVVTLFAVTVLVFLALRILPGDVASNVLGRNATPDAIAHLRHQLGLDRSLVSQYLHWVGGVLHGDLGSSAAALAHGNPDASVWSGISTPLFNSLCLASTTIVLLVPLCLVLGAVAAVREGKATDRLISLPALAFGAMPEFLVGTILIAIFFGWLGVLPPIAEVAPGETPFTHPDVLVLPVLTLLAICLAFTTRMVRAGTIEALHQDYVAMARLNGVGERRVIWRYALRNSLAPSIQAIAQTITYLAGGVIITESVFNFPGVGRALVQAVNGRDVTTVADVTLILAAFYVAINLIADLIVVLLVPKLRTSL